MLEQERQELKKCVSEVSDSIKHLESELKDKERKLCELFIQEENNEVPMQFNTRKLERNADGVIVFSVHKPSDDFNVEWECFLASFQAHSTYHRPEWLSLLSDYSGFELFYFTLRIDNKVVAGVPMLFMKSALFGKNMISIPYVNYGGVLAVSNKLTLSLLDYIKKWATDKKIDYFEFRTTTQGLSLPVKTNKSSMILTLPSTDTLLESKLSAKVRAQYKKTITHKPELLFGGFELLDDFYYVFSRNMRDLGTPVYGKSIFKKILDENKTNSFLCIVKINNKPVSVAFLTGYRDMLEIPWASTLQSANKYDANMWMYRMVLKKAIDLGYKYFDFGRSTRDANTYKFKKQWGAKPINHYWYYLIKSDSIPEANPSNPKYRFFIAVWKRLPVWLANIVGPHIVKNIP